MPAVYVLPSTQAGLQPVVFVFIIESEVRPPTLSDWAEEMGAAGVADVAALCSPEGAPDPAPPHPAKAQLPSTNTALVINFISRSSQNSVFDLYNI